MRPFLVFFVFFKCKNVFIKLLKKAHPFKGDLVKADNDGDVESNDPKAESDGEIDSSDQANEPELIRRNGARVIHTEQYGLRFEQILSENGRGSNKDIELLGLICYISTDGARKNYKIFYDRGSADFTEIPAPFPPIRKTRLGVALIPAYGEHLCPNLEARKAAVRDKYLKPQRAFIEGQSLYLPVDASDAGMLLPSTTTFDNLLSQIQIFLTKGTTNYRI
jgi:hypothetical protein